MSQITTQQFILHLSLIDGIGPAVVDAIIDAWPPAQGWDALYRYGVSDWMQLGLSLNQAHKVASGLTDFATLEKECNSIENADITLITRADQTYPELLKHIHLPPSVLYVRGSLDALSNKAIAIVGSRDADAYARAVIENFVPSFVASGWTIVSGGALGADTMAHEATVNERGKTIAIFGSGLLRPYPRANIQLFDRIIESGGAVISSFSLNAEPNPGNFPARNRIIAGMSKGCVVVQAAIKSGARITAQFALEQGREVFAVPGHVHHELSAGCHALIQEGAKLVTSAADILVEFGEVAPKELDKKPQVAVRVEPAVAIKQQEITTQLSAEYDYNSPQAKILAELKTPASTDEIAGRINISLSQAQSLLFELQMDGAIEQNFAGLWLLSINSALK